MTTTDPASRSRTLTWQDPAPALERSAGLSGIEYLRELAAGELPAPPIGSHIDLAVESIEPGVVVMSAQPDESHQNPLGTVHGGFFATLLDSVCGCAVQSTLPAGVSYTSLDLTVNFLRGIAPTSGRVVATGRVTKPGSRAAFVEADLKDADGRLLATAVSTCLVFPIG